MTTSLPNLRSGSVLITSVIFGFALMAAVGGYIYLTSQALRMANRTFHMNASLNLAEAGVEEGLYALNSFQGLSTGPKIYAAFTNWTKADYDGDGREDAKRTFSYFSSNQGTTGQFTVIVTDWELLNQKVNPPKIIVRAQSSVVREGVIEKVVRATTSRRSLFSNSLMARRDIRFNGNNASVDSFDSNLGPYEPDLPVLGVKEMIEDVNGDGTVNRFGNATVASASVGVNLGNADVWGAVATSGPWPNVGPNGTIADIGASQGTVDPNRVSTDFQANFPVLTPDSGGSPITSLPPKQQDPVTGASYIEIGVAGASAPQIYSLSGDIALKNSTGSTLRIIGPVRIILAGSLTASAGGTGIDIKLMPQLFTTAAATVLVNDNVPPMQLWIGGDLTLTGQGVTNPYQNAASAQIYGTAAVPSGSTGTQSFKIAGNGQLSATVWAPNADLTIVGNGAVFGSFVANTVTASGNAEFHYDESLATNGTGKFSIALWRELITPAQRKGTDLGLEYRFDP